MISSHTIDANGVFIGAAVRLGQGYRFVAVDLRVEELDGSIWPTLDDARRLARHLYTTGRLPPRSH